MYISCVHFAERAHPRLEVESGDVLGGKFFSWQ
jgi:hypothetical protein